MRKTFLVTLLGTSVLAGQHAGAMENNDQGGRGNSGYGNYYRYGNYGPSQKPQYPYQTSNTTSLNPKGTTLSKTDTSYQGGRPYSSSSYNSNPYVPSQKPQDNSKTGNATANSYGIVNIIKVV